MDVLRDGSDVSGLNAVDGFRERLDLSRRRRARDFPDFHLIGVQRTAFLRNNIVGGSMLWWSCVGGGGGGQGGDVMCVVAMATMNFPLFAGFVRISSRLSLLGTMFNVRR